jgi:preprotein translocase subunit SecF
MSKNVVRFNLKSNLDYVSMFKYCVLGSALMAVAALTLYFQKGINYGVDFRGGAEIQVRFTKAADLGELRSYLSGTTVPVSSVQSIGDGNLEYLLKVETDQGDLNQASSQIGEILRSKYGAENVEILKNDIVGPKAGAQLRNSSFQAMAWALLAIMIYLSLRFDFKYAPGAIAALIHDVLFIIAAFILTQKEFSLQIVAALLAIIGYSVNDTVVIYDRVREIERAKPNDSMNTILNQAINETMSRTILTAGATFIVCLLMFFLGGGVIHDFFFALSLGILSGTYSTIFIASPITIWLDKLQTKRAGSPKTA